MDNKQKILVCGPVNGSIKTLFSRIEKIIKTAQYEALFCVGNFLGDDESVFADYINGSKKVLLPTYFLGSSNKLMKMVKDNIICEDLTCLGNKGLYTTASGMKIVYLSGTESDKATDNPEDIFKTEDVVKLKNSCLKNYQEYRGCDLLLTNQRPSGVSKEHDVHSSKLIAWLSMNIKPRYHFSVDTSKYVELPPFRFPSDEISSIDLASRFIALNSVSNAAKEKYIYAMNIVPLDKMRVTDLMLRSTDEVECPYLEISFAELMEKNKQFFFDMDGGRKQHGNSENARKKFKPSTDTEKCWFCLSSAEIEKHLIVSIGENFYVAMPKGPLNDQHVLILPINHIQSTAILSEEHFAELLLFKRAIKKYYQSLNKVAFFFERNYKTSHLQVNAIGLDKGIEWQIKETFDEKAEEFNLKFEELPGLKRPSDLPAEGAYFVAEFPDNSTLLTRQMTRFPINFGRDVLCASSLLNCEDKVDWRNCLLPKNIENETANIFREEYKDFDFTRD